MVQVSPNMTIIDMTLKGVSPGTYNVSVRESGDISQGARSTGGIWDLLQAQKASPPRTVKGVFGTIEVSRSGMGSVFLDKPIQIWEMIGRAIVVSRKTENFDKEDQDTLVGVIARSAGVWDNDKTVCSCSGKTVWDERKEQVEKGML
jgi:copper chaperone for superoxide dismutase